MRSRRDIRHMKIYEAVLSDCLECLSSTDLETTIGCSVGRASAFSAGGRWFVVRTKIIDCSYIFCFFIPVSNLQLTNTNFILLVRAL